MADYDVLVVGGGPIGAALTLALRGSGLAVGLLEARAPQAAADPRPIALSHGSRLILERLGVWERLTPVTPILRIHVSQRGGFGRVVPQRESGAVLERGPQVRVDGLHAIAPPAQAELLDDQRVEQADEVGAGAHHEALVGHGDRRRGLPLAAGCPRSGRTLDVGHDRGARCLR